MVDPTPAERSVARAHVADSADRSAALWLRATLYGFLAALTALGAVFLVATGSWWQAGLSLAASGWCARRSATARREAKRVFASAVETLETHRSR